MNHMDRSSWIGLIVGFGAIILGCVLEGGHIGSLMQATAALIVIGGTIGAVMVSNPKRDLFKGVELARQSFGNDDESQVEKNLGLLVEYARIARKEGVVALEPRVKNVEDPFVQRILKNIIDGLDGAVVRGIAEAEIDHEEHELLNAAKIWTDAGGYAPTIGIIGAVLGLIHVMGNLSDTSKLGAGIAVAFVATIYGVSLANLIFLPIGAKLKKHILNKSREKRILLDGALLIATSLNPMVIEQQLKASVHEA